MDDETGREATSGERPGEDVALPPKAVLTLDHVFDALGHPRRRYICYTLPAEDEWTLTDLATKLAAWEHDVAEVEVTPEQRDRVYVSLYHAHIPKLVDDGIVTLDEVTETVEPAENAAQVLQALAGIGSSVDAAQEEHARGEIDAEED
ncbi:DUF7344 domain-containing protein [Haloarchaeobius baliensis]|uniref:DUF7344 domain-containing protein n=1 Tax=Haloarchaeobius baliensis TaxID=1670458 RepID=UPI003F8859EB